MNRVAIVDYGMGNLRSVAKAIEHVAPRARVAISDDPQVIDAADRIVVPGQGAMGACMRQLDARGLRESVLRASRQKPFLGICIGLQMLFEHSEEDDSEGLGRLPGSVQRFPPEVMAPASGQRLKVPHMGWNSVHWLAPHPLRAGIEQDEYFYFVHSYRVVPAASALSIARCEYGLPFTCAVAEANIFAVQFHPEKSARAGLVLLGNFMTWKP